MRIPLALRLRRMVSTHRPVPQVAVVDAITYFVFSLLAYDGFMLGTLGIVSILVGFIGGGCAYCIQRRPDFERSIRRTIAETTGYVVAVSLLCWSVLYVFGARFAIDAAIPIVGVYGLVVAPIGYRLGGFVDPRGTAKLLREARRATRPRRRAC